MTLPNRSLHHWLAFCHRSYGRWDIYWWAEWFDAWKEHVLNSTLPPSKKGPLLIWGYGCPTVVDR